LIKLYSPHVPKGKVPEVKLWKALFGDFEAESPENTSISPQTSGLNLTSGTLPKRKPLDEYDQALKKIIVSLIFFRKIEEKKIKYIFCPVVVGDPRGSCNACL
jgi:hypothetical protein